ncbi:hypothetical protein GCM10009716_17410 [Streptomyces sodiiphilus]|uniref:Spermidine synthase n=1 Tax=Streptomyces sodiiphilus TaxID=226217 RepID=A0ABN2NZL6_9ACTN
MLDSTEAAPPVSAPAGEEPSVRLPVPAGIGRALVLAAVFVCAACGLVYELQLIALADYLVGDTVTQTSIVLSLMVFAMGIGSLAAKRLRRSPSFSFGMIETLLALAGGSSAMVLYAGYLWFGEARPVLIGYSLLLGVLIGAEMPLLMTLIQRIRRQDAGGAMADLSAADYVGALTGGLAFPFLLLPLLGRLNAALLTGVVNTLAGAAVVLWLFRRDLTRRARWVLLAAGVTVVAVLLAATFWVSPLESATGQAVEADGPAADR